jgi:hypothetical protein
MKKDNRFKISMAELQQIIKEEYASMAKDAKRAEEIQERLQAINEELETLPKTISEVEASGTKKVKSTGWTGAGEGDVKYGEKFEKIGSHLKEDDEVEGELEIGGEEAEEMGYFEMKFAELGRELDAKMNGGEYGEEEGEEEVEDMGLEVVGDEEGEEGEEEGEEEEMDEYAEIQPDGEHGNVQKVNEDLEEPIEGETPAQDSEARFNDYMEKDKHVHEGVKGGTSLLSEGFSSERKNKLDSELERMKALARIK